MAKRGLGSPKVSKQMRSHIASLGGRASHGGGRPRGRKGGSKTRRASTSV